MKLCSSCRHLFYANKVDHLITAGFRCGNPRLSNIIRFMHPVVINASGRCPGWGMLTTREMKKRNRT
jgi:hypothetical protein